MQCHAMKKGRRARKGKVERIIRTGWELENPEKWEMGVNSKFSWNLVFTSPSVLLSLSPLSVYFRISAIQPKKLDNLCMTLHKFLISSLKQQGEVKTEKEKRRKKNEKHENVAFDMKIILLWGVNGGAQQHDDDIDRREKWAQPNNKQDLHRRFIAPKNMRMAFENESWIIGLNLN